jgi:hypothetical protein
VVVAVEDVVLVVAVVGLVVPWELHATDSRPRRTDVAIPVAAAHRRELFITGAIHTQASCETCCDGVGRLRTGCCQPRAGTPLTPSVDCA